MSESMEQNVSGGFTTDSTPSMQPPNTVRKLRNMRVVSDTNNTFSAESLLGTFDSFHLNPNYFPIGWVKCGHKIIILSTNDITGADSHGEIGIATLNQDEYIGSYTPLYNHISLRFNAAHQIEAWVYDENESIMRAYCTGFYNT